MQKLFILLLFLTFTVSGKPVGTIEIGGYGEVYHSSINNTAINWIGNIYPLCRYFIGNSLYVSPHYSIRFVNRSIDYDQSLKYTDLMQFIGIKAGYKWKIIEAIGIYASAGVADNNYSFNYKSVEIPKHIIHDSNNEFAILFDLNITYAITHNISFGILSFLNAQVDRYSIGEMGHLFGLTYVIKGKP